MSALARRYADAAVAAAGGGAQQASLARAMGRLADAMATMPDLREAAFSPLYRAQIAPVLSAVVAHLGGGEVVARLATLMARNGRLGALGDVAERIGERVDRQEGRLRARLESAVPLSRPQVEAIVGLLGRRCSAHIEVSEQVRPELIGGWVCHVGAVTFDASVRRALDNLGESLHFGMRGRETG